MKEILDFKSLEEAIEFWETHDSADYLDDMEEVSVEVELRRNLLHPRLTVLAYRPEHCPRCQHPLEDIVLDYVVSRQGQLMMIANVPALRCQTNGHEYILEEIIDKLEKLFDLERKQKLKPSGIVSVPVFNWSLQNK